ncbi:alpha/beta hydrolase [Phanerochaete sordida]|uniref:Alpha/beta hydrolase n=1 Tax=Phanerochaete sordida TaxID=48140 RepID=A0A9P3GST6_9APHY|nr:alpha/beta hydrolase [Phanerochaete sordida]
MSSEAFWRVKQPVSPLLSKPPLKGLYLFAVVGGALLRLPYWVLVSALPPLRPRKAWSFSRTMLVQVACYFIPELFRTLGFPIKTIDPKEVDPAKGYVWVEPTPEYVAGEIQQAAAVNGVEPARVIGYMQYRKGDERRADEKARPGEKVMYYLHGGGYFMGDSSGPSAWFCSKWLEESPAFGRTFQLDYRLATADPLPRTNNFPAALLDAVAGYHHLVNVLGFAPRDVLFAGESVGAHLHVNLVRYLAQQRFAALPLPGSLVLLSPVADWGGSHIGAAHWRANAHLDMVESFYYGYPTRCQLGALPPAWAELSAWISPGSLKLPETHGLFAGFPPTYMTTGDAECTLDQMQTLRDRMRADIGEDNFTYLEVPNALHAFPVLSGHTPENIETIRKLVQWAEKIHA